MNKYDEFYDFRLATIKDVDAVMKFIHDEWGENHILARDKKLFLWQYGRTEYSDNENVNIVLMTEHSTSNIVGIIGFVAYSNNKNKLEISPAITKVKDQGLIPMSGVELIRRQKLIVGEEAQFASGTNPKTIKPLLEKIFKHEVGMMQQFYMLNPHVHSYKIADVKLPTFASYENTDVFLQETKNFEDIKDIIVSSNDIPLMSFKSPEFIIKRYFKHPKYTYKIFYVENKCVLIGREIEAFGRKILRLVDYRGNIDIISMLGNALHKLLDEKNYEYIDFMLWPISEALMAKTGFQLLDVDGDNIIPSYFEPYIKTNVRNYAHRTKNIIVFKADGDQDRPNM